MSQASPKPAGANLFFIAGQFEEFLEGQNSKVLLQTIFRN